MANKQHAQVSKNYLNFLRINTRRYRGEWIAMAGKKVVAHGKRADKIYQVAIKLYPNQKISLAKIPKEDSLVL